MNTFIAATAEALFLVLLLSLPPLLCGLVVGFAVSLFQALTQIQEQTLTFVPKIIVIFFVIMLTSYWILETMQQFTQKIFELMLKVGA